MCLLVLCFQQNCQKSVGTGRTRIKFSKFFVDILYQLQKFTYTPRSLAYCWVLYLSWKWKSWSGDFERVGKYHLEVTLRREEGTGSWYQILKKHPEDRNAPGKALSSQGPWPPMAVMYCEASQWQPNFTPAPPAGSKCPWHSGGLGILQPRVCVSVDLDAKFCSMGLNPWLTPKWWLMPLVSDLFLCPASSWSLI